MTEDTSPENLRKFLESDDPAMVLMGLSMAKGTEVPELLGEIIWIYMTHVEKTVRDTAELIVNNNASKRVTKILKTNWKYAYWESILFRSGPKEAFVHKKLGTIGAGLSNTSASILDPLIRTLKDNIVSDKDGYRSIESAPRGAAAYTLGKIGDKEAIEPLIDTLENNYASITTDYATLYYDFLKEPAAHCIDAIDLLGGHPKLCNLSIQILETQMKAIPPYEENIYHDKVDQHQYFWNIGLVHSCINVIGNSKSKKGKDILISLYKEVKSSGKSIRNYNKKNKYSKFSPKSLDEKNLLNSIEENLEKIGNFDREELDKPTKWNRLMELRNKLPAKATASIFFPNQPWRLDKPWFNRTKMPETEIDETIAKLEKLTVKLSDDSNKRACFYCNKTEPETDAPYTHDASQNWFLSTFQLKDKKIEACEDCFIKHSLSVK